MKTKLVLLLKCLRTAVKSAAINMTRSDEGYLEGYQYCIAMYTKSSRYLYFNPEEVGKTMKLCRLLGVEIEYRIDERLNPKLISGNVFFEEGHGRNRHASREELDDMGLKYKTVILR